MKAKACRILCIKKYKASNNTNPRCGNRSRLSIEQMPWEAACTSRHGTRDASVRQEKRHANVPSSSSVEPADKPGSVVSSHSSRPCVAARLEQPTRERRGPRHDSPIRSCSRWGLPCHAALAPRAVRSYRTFSPLPRTSCDAVRRFAFCCTFRRLAPPRRYLAPCPVEPGLSSAHASATRLPGRLHGQSNRAGAVALRLRRRAASRRGSSRRPRRVVAHDDTLMRIAVCALPDGAAAPARAVVLQRRDDALRRRGVAERDQHLIQHDLVEHVDSRLAAGLRRSGAPGGSCARSARRRPRGRASAAPPTLRRRARGATAPACNRRDCGTARRSADTPPSPPSRRAAPRHRATNARPQS